MPANTSNGTKSSRFELPALNLNFGSITDGTNIPPPPDSPVEKPTEKPAQSLEKKEEAKKEAAPVAAIKPEATNGNSAGTKRPADDVPPSPTVSTQRPGSLRRLLSRTLLNNTYAEGQNGSAAPAASVNGSRPASRSGGSIMDERKSKRSSGWFRRLRGGESKRSSLMYEQTPSPTTASKPSGPPPPMIPELKELEKDEGSLGGSDLFKNIK